MMTTEFHKLAELTGAVPVDSSAILAEPSLPEGESDIF
jgi:hypothetical protein